MKKNTQSIKKAKKQIYYLKSLLKGKKINKIYLSSDHVRTSFKLTKNNNISLMYKGDKEFKTLDLNIFIWSKKDDKIINNISVDTWLKKGEKIEVEKNKNSIRIRKAVNKFNVLTIDLEF